MITNNDVYQTLKKMTLEEFAQILSSYSEMKNENDTTATKHKNEDFLKELDKDRREKNCEYAVLVSMLEAKPGLLGDYGYNTIQQGGVS